MSRKALGLFLHSLPPSSSQTCHKTAGSLCTSAWAACRECLSTACCKCHLLILHCRCYRHFQEIHKGQQNDHQKPSIALTHCGLLELQNWLCWCSRAGLLSQAMPYKLSFPNDIKAMRELSKALLKPSASSDLVSSTVKLSLFVLCVERPLHINPHCRIWCPGTSPGIAQCGRFDAESEAKVFCSNHYFHSLLRTYLEALQKV